MITLREAYKNSKEILSLVYEQTEAVAVTNYLFENLFGVSSKEILLRGEVPFEQQDELTAVIDRLKNHEPIQHVLGYGYFSGLKILVSSDVLIPRPETEELVQWIIEVEKEPVRVIADFCSGSACLSLAMRKNFPNAKVIATDISEKAIEMGKKSEQLNFNTATIQFEIHDLLNHEYHFLQPDFVVCNPPYIKIKEKESMGVNVLAFEPHIALFVYNEDALLFYKRVLQLFGKREMPRVYFELNPITADDLFVWCQEMNLTCLFKNDMSGKKRFARISK